MDTQEQNVEKVREVDKSDVRVFVLASVVCGLLLAINVWAILNFMVVGFGGLFDLFRCIGICMLLPVIFIIAATVSVKAFGDSAMRKWARAVSVFNTVLGAAPIVLILFAIFEVCLNMSIFRMNIPFFHSGLLALGYVLMIIKSFFTAKSYSSENSFNSIMADFHHDALSDFWMLLLGFIGVAAYLFMW